MFNVLVKMIKLYFVELLVCRWGIVCCFRYCVDTEYNTSWFVFRFRCIYRTVVIRCVNLAVWPRPTVGVDRRASTPAVSVRQSAAIKVSCQLSATVSRPFSYTRGNPKRTGRRTSLQKNTRSGQDTNVGCITSSSHLYKPEDSDEKTSVVLVRRRRIN